MLSKTLTRTTLGTPNAAPIIVWFRETGVMHNQVRMVVASFLVKHLPIDWRDGESWFWDMLVDADAGSNPTLPGEKFDPNGTYVRRWVPELKDLPAT